MQQSTRSRGLLPLSAALCVMILMLLCSQEAVEGAKRGLGLCANMIIPSLFPFLFCLFY